MNQKARSQDKPSETRVSQVRLLYPNARPWPNDLEYCGLRVLDVGRVIDGDCRVSCPE